MALYFVKHEGLLGEGYSITEAKDPEDARINVFHALVEKGIINASDMVYTSTYSAEEIKLKPDEVMIISVGDY
jgi:transcriptional regulator of nitric oxide reductase